MQIAYPAGASLRFGAGANRETVDFIGAEIAAHLDRPLKAGGTRLPLDRLPGVLVLNQDATGTRVGVQTAPPQPTPERIPFALKNALLITGPVRSLALSGDLQNDNVTDGLLALSFPLQSLLPALPDPYITPYSAQLQLPANLSLQAVTSWSEPASPQFSEPPEPQSNRAWRGGRQQHHQLQFLAGDGYLKRDHHRRAPHRDSHIDGDCDRWGAVGFPRTVKHADGAGAPRRSVNRLP